MGYSLPNKEIISNFILLGFYTCSKIKPIGYLKLTKYAKYVAFDIQLMNFIFRR